MNHAAAQSLAEQLKITLPNQKTKKVRALELALETAGLDIGVDQTNGDWVVVRGPAREELARAP